MEELKAGAAREIEVENEEPAAAIKAQSSSRLAETSQNCYPPPSSAVYPRTEWRQDACSIRARTAWSAPIYPKQQEWPALRVDVTKASHGLVLWSCEGEKSHCFEPDCQSEKNPTGAEMEVALAPPGALPGVLLVDFLALVLPPSPPLIYSSLKR